MSVEIKNLNPFFLALLDLEIQGPYRTPLNTDFRTPIFARVNWAKLRIKLLAVHYSKSASIRWACTIPSLGDHANTVNLPSCEATSATPSR